MKVREILSERFGDGFGGSQEEMENPYAAADRERQYRSEEEERANGELRNSFMNDKTSLEDFDIDTVKKIISMTMNKKANLRRQGEEMLQTWEEELRPDVYIDNDVFNKVFKQFEQLKDSTDTPIIKFNKLYSITKELSDASDDFDEWSKSDAAEEMKWNTKAGSR